MTDNPNSDEEAVGYRNPPRHSRFKQGQSGNPNGRPKGSKNIATIVREVLAEEISVGQRGIETKLPKREVIVRKQVEKALRGDQRAAEYVLKLDMDIDTIEALREAADKSRELSPSLRDVFKAFLERETAEVKRPDESSDEGNASEGVELYGEEDRP